MRLDLATSPHSVVHAAHHLPVMRPVTQVACWLGAVAALGGLTACSSQNAHDDLAAWDVGPQQVLSPDRDGVHSNGARATKRCSERASGEAERRG